jgi:CRP/FNR family transcriptional regulator, cyclic AMP receptor protein
MSAVPVPRHLPAAILDRVPFFSVLSAQQLAGVLPYMHYHVHRPGTVIIRAGDRPDKVYILIAGRAQVVLEDGAGRELVLCSIGKNEFFGEMGAIDGHSRSAAVQASEPCEVLSFSTTAFVECLKSNARATLYVVQSLVSRLRATDIRVTELAFAEVTVRVARVLLEAAREQRGEWVAELGTEQIARVVAASREMVSRVLKRFNEQQIIRRDKRMLVLLDRDALDDIAHGER